MPLLIDQALRLADDGRPVFPCRGDKTPACPHGHKDATTDPDEIERLFAHRNARLIGLATGKASGVVVIDIDVKDGKDGRRWPWYDDLPPATRRVQTRSGGYHIYLRYPDEHIPCSASTLFPGVDVRGDGGYVIVPPSPGYHIVCDDEPATMPQWLAELCNSPPKTKSNPTGAPDNPVGVDVGSSLRRLAEGEDPWHTDMLRLTAHWVAKGNMSDEQILEHAPGLTWPGYTVEQTIAEMQKMIEGARAKFDPIHRMSQRAAIDEPEACYGYSLNEVQGWHLEPARMFNDWLPEGLTLLGGRPKAGKSWLAERAAFEIAQRKKTLHFALEYGQLMMQERFSGYDNVQPLHLKLYPEGALARLDQGGHEQLVRLIEHEQAELAIIDTFAMIKRPGDMKGYEAEYAAMSDLKRLVTETGASILALHHTRKPSANDTGDVFDGILGSSALTAVPDNLLVFVNRDDSPVLHGKGRLIEPYELPLAWSDPGFTVAEPDAHMRDKAPLQYQIKTHLRTAGPANNKELAKVFGKSEPGIANATRKLIDSGEVQRGLDGLMRVGE